MKGLLRYVLSLLFVGSAIAGCVRNEEFTPAPYAGESTTAAFSVELPAPAVVATRGGQTEAEARVDNIYLLIFKNNGSYFDCKIINSSAITTEDAPGGSAKEIKSFRTSIPVSASGRDADRYDIVLLANVSGDLAAAVSAQISAKASKQAFLGALTFVSVGNPAVPFPMASLDKGPQTISVGADFTGAGAFRLIRMVARVDVRFGTELDGYTVEEAVFYNHNRFGNVWHSGLTAASPTLTAPACIPSTAGKVDNSSYRVANTVADKTSFAGQLYALEANVTDNGGNPLDKRPCVVVRLTDGTGDLGYYRIDFRKNDGTYVDIIRNFRYIFSIARVGGSGFSDAETAYNAGPMNIEANVVDWDDYEYESGLWNGAYDIRFGSLNAVFTARAEIPTQTFSVLSNVPKLKFSDFTNDDTAGDNAWVEISTSPDVWSNGHLRVISISDDAGDEYKKYTIYVTATPAAATDSDRKSTFKIGGEGLEAVFTITQKGLADEIAAMPGILAVDDAGVLNLDGRGRTVYFKWGSLIAVSGGANGNAFDAGAIAWAPAGYQLDRLRTAIGSQTGAGAWGLIPYAGGVNYPDGFPAMNAVAGLGDPCRLASKSGSLEGEYRMPTGNPYERFEAGEWTVYQGVAGRWSAAAAPADNLFYPAAGRRNHTSGASEDVGSKGHYWSSTPNGTTDGYVMYFTGDGAFYGNVSADRSQGRAVRCVRDDGGRVTPPTKGIDAVEGILAVDESGNLNLDGNGKVVYFKWGSVVAVQGGARGDEFKAASDIAWVPREYDAAKITGSGTEAWAMVPYAADGTVLPENTPANLALGLGDPCRLASKNGSALGSYRMPKGYPFEKFPFSSITSANTNWKTAAEAGALGYGSEGMLDDLSIPNLFYPAAGQRQAATGAVFGIASYGYYWSSMSDVNDKSYFMRFTSTSISHTGMSARPAAMTVRCVPATTRTTPPTKGADAVEGVLAVDEHGNLNLDGIGKTVLFKWGSTVAIQGGNNGDAFDADRDIAWVPSGFDLTRISGSGKAGWATVPYAGGTDYPDGFPANTSANLAFGLGDPCRLASKKGSNIGDYYMPTGNPYEKFLYSTDQTSNPKWKDALAAAALGYTSVGMLDDETMPQRFYPAAGLRNGESGAVSFVGRNGYYWTVTPLSALKAYHLGFAAAGVYPSYNDSRSCAMAIRCVSSNEGRVKVPTKGADAPEWFLAVDGNGNLNLDGNGKMVYFKWGSVVATQGGDDGDEFSAINDIAWVPPGFDVTTISGLGAAGWATVPYAGETDFSASFPANTPANLARGLGDPCRLASKSGNVVGDFRMPTGNSYNGGKEIPALSSTWQVSYGLKGKWYNQGQADAVFYPVTGFRSDSEGKLELTTTRGIYWTNTHINGDYSFNMGVAEDRIDDPNAGLRTFGLAIRCVPDDTGRLNAPSKGVNAVKDILAVDENGVLNLDGRGKTVYFKWGSTVALQGGDNGDKFNAVKDIAWVPSGFDVTKISGSGPAGWTTVPYATTASLPSNTSANLANGLGDPCGLASKNGSATSAYHLPAYTYASGYEQFFGAVDLINNPDWITQASAFSQYGCNVAGMFHLHYPQFYPAAGYRSEGTGVQGLVGECGYFWTMEPYDGEEAHFMYFSPEFIRVRYVANRDCAFAVRCVK